MAIKTLIIGGTGAQGIPIIRGKYKLYNIVLNQLTKKSRINERWEVPDPSPHQGH